DVVRVARTVDLHERILRLPRGYDTVLGEEAELSGGETQRIAIARALLAETPVLVLDEATAFADPETERAVRSALADPAGDRTVLVSAHRLRPVADADTVLVLEDGAIVERGGPAELLARTAGSPRSGGRTGPRPPTRLAAMRRGKERLDDPHAAAPAGRGTR